MVTHSSMIVFSNFGTAIRTKDDFIHTQIYPMLLVPSTLHTEHLLEVNDVLEKKLPQVLD